MERFNSEGILRKDLLRTLKHRPAVMNARTAGYCMLCRRKGVNASGLCDTCYSMLDGEEFAVAELWLSGKGP